MILLQGRVSAASTTARWSSRVGRCRPCARFEHGNCSFRSRPVEGVNSPVALPHGYLGILKLAINPIPRGRIIGDSRSCEGPVPFGVLREARSRFRVFGGADSTAPPSGRARRRDPAAQQYYNGIRVFHMTGCSLSSQSFSMY